MGISLSVNERLDRLTPDQRTAAMAPPGPVLCVAPAGSGKTTTLIARIAWLIDSGIEPGAIAAITFNKRAADELETRLVGALVPLGLVGSRVRVRTFHALGREILRDAGLTVSPLVDRDALLRELNPSAGSPLRRRLDDAFSRFKLDLGITAAEVAEDPDPGPVARAFLAYEAAIAAMGGLDFDDLVIRPLRTLEADPPLLARWRSRCAHLLVDEVQDVDRSQLALALLLAAPDNQIFLVGDDDQSIYGWRLADVRRVLDLDARLPGLRRVDLVTNFRCPAPVVERSIRLIEGNRERFAKQIAARPQAPGRLVLAPDAGDDDERARQVFASWGLRARLAEDAEGEANANEPGCVILARTNRELLPAATVALELGIAFRAERIRLPLEDPRLEQILAALEMAELEEPLLVALGRVRQSLSQVALNPLDVDGTTGGLDPGPGLPDDDDGLGSFEDLLASVLTWAAAYRDARAFATTVRSRRADLDRLHRADATLTLATAHATKGLEFDQVAVVDMDADRFPSRRSLDDALEPERALEEERRLAYVAWTRARQSLTLVYDPAAPSRFLREAFEPEELSLPR